MRGICDTAQRGRAPTNGQSRPPRTTRNTSSWSGIGSCLGAADFLEILTRLGFMRRLARWRSRKFP
jgi:hypothetical protein